MKRVANKGSRRATLPDRRQLKLLTGGTALGSAMGRYAKATPAALDVDTKGMSLKPRSSPVRCWSAP